MYIKRNILNLTIRLKIITSRLFLPTLSEREKKRAGERESGESVLARDSDGDRFAREIFYGLLASGAEKGTLLQLFNGIFLFVTCFCNTRETERERNRDPAL